MATLYSTAVTPTAYPAVSLHGVGSNGGQAAAFLFDLASSIVYMRQGNPAWSGQHRDGQTEIRPDDLFYGAASFDPEPDWIDIRKVAIPQADEQQRLLANMIISMNASKRLLPRFWYFPDGRKAVVVMTGDDHDHNATRPRFNQFYAESPINSMPNNWNNIRGTSYYFPYTGPIDGQPLDGPALLNSEVTNWTAQGFEISLHLDTGCADYLTWDSLNSMFTNELNTLALMYPGLPAPQTHRCHCVAWSQYTMLPEVERANGIRLDVTYYYWPASWSASWPGVFTGSGMPMRFVTSDGSVIDNYQAATVMTDESGQVYPYTVASLLNRALGPEGYYGAFVCNMHTDFTNSFSDSQQECDSIIQTATNDNVAVISAKQLLTWVDARNASAISSIVSSNGLLTFSVTANTNAGGLQVMAPIPFAQSVSQVKSNGVSVAYLINRVKGIQYAMFPAPTGNYEIDYVPDTTPPVVTSMSPTNSASQVGLHAAASIMFSKAMNAATVNASSLTLLDASNHVLTATVTYDPTTLTAVLTPQSILKLSSAYTIKVQGGAGGVADVAGNLLAGNVITSFNTITQFSTSVWPNTAIPAILTSADTNAPSGTAELDSVSAGDTSPIEVGMKFQSAIGGYVTGIRFYKGGANTGTHIGNLWTSTGTLLASVVFTNETASGWQYQAFSNSVLIASNTTYIVSYHMPMGGYSINPTYFSASGVDSYPLMALADGADGPNGVFNYSVNSAFPTNSFNAANYWVDLTFVGNNVLSTNGPAVNFTTPVAGATSVIPGAPINITFNEAMDPASINTNTILLLNSSNSPVNAAVSYNSAAFTAALIPAAPFALSATYSADVRSGPTGVGDLVGNIMTNDYIWSFTTASYPTFSVWNNSVVPAVIAAADTNSAELGVKFQSVVNGYITGITFYKAAANLGPHLGNLWALNGTLLASVAFTNETASGWQYQSFAQAVPIASNTTYIASYFTPVGCYSVDGGYFSGSGHTNYPLIALADGVAGGNGVYNYSTNSAFPTNTYNSANYWVDVTFLTNVPPIAITSPALPFGIVNNLYATTLNASGGTLPYHWSIISGSLPPGLTLNTTNGVINGVPTNSGIFNCFIQVADSGSPAQSMASSFSIVVSRGTITTIWPNSASPVNVDSGPDISVELGVKFRSDVTGFITGIRFYKAAANSGTHLGDLWTTNGVLLSSATFTGETASGWQQVAFAAPVLIASNTVYVASYHCNNGHYSADSNYFAVSGVDNPPLHVPASGPSGGNGVFGYGSGSFFPNQTFQAANYWVDVVFVSSLAPSLPVQGGVTNNELVALVVTNTAADNDLPVQTLTYTLAVTNVNTGQAVTNASITTNGVITWTPQQVQSPGTNVFTTVVSDGTLNATNSFTVVVVEVNQAPVLPGQSNLISAGLTVVGVTNTASEPNIHSVTVGYGLVVGPAGASVDTNGVIRWTPALNQVPSTNLFAMVVTNHNPYDLSNPQLTATNSFIITVSALHNGPVLGSLPNVMVNALSLLTVTNAALDNDIPLLPLSYTLINPPTGVVIGGAGVISWTPSGAQAPSTNVITTVVSDGSLSATNRFTVTVNAVGNGFRIISVTTSNGVATVTWTSVPGNYYRLQYNDNLAGTNWSDVTPDVLATNLTASMTNVLGGANQRFYRVMLVQTIQVPPPVIQSLGVTNGVVTVIWSAVSSHIYQLQYNGNLSLPNWIAVVPNVTATGSTAMTTDVVGTSAQRFYRILVVQ